MRTAFCIVWSVLLASTTMAAANDAAKPAAARAAYQAIAAHLDTGGDLYVVANLQGVVKDVTAMVGALADVAGAAAQGQAPAQLGPRLQDFMSRSGLDAIAGYGLSTVPRADGLHNVKLFLGRDPQASAKPAWRAMVGEAPRAPTCLDYLPRDTVMARTGTGDAAAFWLLLRQAFETLGGQAGSQQFANLEQGLSQALGTNVSTVVAALGGECFWSLQLAADQTMSLPLPAAPGQQAGQLTIPSPAMLLGIKVRDAAPARALAAALTRSGMPLERQTAEGATLLTARLPMPMPLPISLTCAQHDGMLLLGSSPAVVQLALRARGARDGLVADPDFRAAFATLPAANNGIAYIHPRFSATLRDVQGALARQGDNEALARLQSLMMKQNELGAFAVVNERDGVAVVGVGSSGGREMLTQLAMAPIGMLAGIAVPSFVNARSRARSTACRSYLRMIEGAKEQWAMEHNKTAADTPTEQEIGLFLPGGRMPVCPQGGTYTIGKIGADPTCSLPGHQLP